MENINSIVEFEDYNTGFGGYKIRTTKQEITLAMEMQGNCCEVFGYFMSEDDFEDFIGTELIDIKITDTELKEGQLKQHYDHVWDTYEGWVMFVDIITSEGTLQFVAYNDHNGYYGHKAKIISKQLNYELEL